MSTYKPVGTSDEILECDLCGKSNLRNTVVLAYIDAEGESEGERFVGRDCAAKLITGVKSVKAGNKIAREAEAAMRRRAEAVKNSKAMLAFFESAGPRMNEKMDAYAAANPSVASLPILEQLKATAASIKRHTEIVETGGLSAL